jgi:hypothetical protein
MTKISSRQLTFIALMAAMGNVLSFISIQLSNMPTIPIGPVQVSLALDLSHVATFIAALVGGPIVGGLTGLIGGMVAAFQFGFSQGNLITGFGLPLGKALTGLSAGFLFSKVDVDVASWRSVIVTVISYIPEAILTLVLFIYLMPLYLFFPVSVATSIVIPIVVKGFIEMIVMGILVGLINRNPGFRSYKASV